MQRNRVVGLSCCLALFAQLLLAQPLSSIQGQWVGTLTQEQGGYRDEYRFEIYFQTDADGLLAGKTYVTAPNVLGVFSFSGKKRGKVYYIAETDLRYSRKPEDLSWCYKTMQLRVVQREGAWYLEGPWQGTSSYGVCIPGWLSLRWIPPKA